MHIKLQQKAATLVWKIYLMSFFSHFPLDADDGGFQVDFFLLAGGKTF